MKNANSLWKFVVGMLLGVLLTYLYVRFGFQLPGVVRLGESIADEAIVMTAEADVYNPQAPPAVRQRALAVVVGRKPDWFIEIDAAIGQRFFEEVLRRKALRRAELLKQKMAAYQAVLNQPALRQLQEKRFGVSDALLLKRQMLIADIREDELLHDYLRRHFPNASPDGLADLVLNVYQNGLKPQASATADGSASDNRAVR